MVQLSTVRCSTEVTMAGEVFNFANYKSKYGTSWFKTYSVQNQNITLIANAPNICVDFYVETGAMLRTASISITTSYYNGSSWITAWTKNMSCSGKNGSEHYRWAHNRAAESYPYRNDGLYHMWQFAITGSNENKNSWYGADVWMGGINVFTDAEYESLCKNRPIRYCRSDEIWSLGGKYGSAQAFLDGEHPGVYRGSEITDATGKYMVATDI